MASKKSITVQSVTVHGGEWMFISPGILVERQASFDASGQLRLREIFDEGTTFEWSRTRDGVVTFECNKHLHIDPDRRVLRVLKD